MHDHRQRPDRARRLEHLADRRARRCGPSRSPGRTGCRSSTSSSPAAPTCPHQSEIFIPGGQTFRDITQLSALGIPTIALVFGNSTAGGAYLPGMSDYVVMVKQRAKVFLGGPPLVKMATGEESDDESLGGAEMHARVCGLADYFAPDELDALRLGRQIVRRLNLRKLGPAPAAPAGRPATIPRSCSASRRPTCGCRSTRATCSPGSSTAALRRVQAALRHVARHRLGRDPRLPGRRPRQQRGVLFNEEAQKAAQFIQLANQIDTPLLFLQNMTGYMVGKDYEQRGIIKDGAKMINAVANSTVPHLTINMGGRYGAGNYGMCGRAYEPRFLFTWPNAKTAVMGPQQLAGVMSIVARQSAASQGRPFDEEADAAMRDGGRGADRARVARPLHDRAALRRRHHRSARHPHGPRDLPVGRAQQRRRGRRGFGVFRM